MIKLNVQFHVFLFFDDITGGLSKFYLHKSTYLLILHKSEWGALTRRLTIFLSLGSLISKVTAWVFLDNKNCVKTKDFCTKYSIVVVQVVQEKAKK